LKCERYTVVTHTTQPASINTFNQYDHKDYE